MQVVSNKGPPLERPSRRTDTSAATRASSSPLLWAIIRAFLHWASSSGDGNTVRCWVSTGQSVMAAMLAAVYTAHLTDGGSQHASRTVDRV